MSSGLGQVNARKNQRRQLLALPRTRCSTLNFPGLDRCAWPPPRGCTPGDAASFAQPSTTHLLVSWKRKRSNATSRHRVATDHPSTVRQMTSPEELRITHAGPSAEPELLACVPSLSPSFLRINTVDCLRDRWRISPSLQTRSSWPRSRDSAGRSRSPAPRVPRFGALRAEDVAEEGDSRGREWYRRAPPVTGHP